MNNRHYAKLGISCDLYNVASQTVQAIAKRNRSVEKPLRYNIQQMIERCAATPQAFVDDTLLGDLAKGIIEEQNFVMPEPIDYTTWGADGIDEGSHVQMRTACRLPCAVAGALMPDAHVGYGLPIGGVLALDNAVAPNAVGVDIACRMKLSIYDMRPDVLLKRHAEFCEALEEGTEFGVGGTRRHKVEHAIMDDDWTVSRITRERKDVAFQQLGTSGSGNHFVEWGVMFIDESEILQPGEYVALLSHSGSRGAGAAVCKTYHDIARSQLPRRFADFHNLAWLSMDSEAGMEYWASMNLMGRYAAANHDVIHYNVSRLLGEFPILAIENHHNFAWEETHGGRRLYVHRKGATPAGKGVYGIIPGSMGTPAYLVKGKGNPISLESASHGAGRIMSRTQAKSKFRFKAVANDLATRGITVLSAGPDEVPGVYKDINAVIAAQTDLVDKVARFEPRIVKMCGDDSRAED